MIRNFIFRFCLLCAAGVFYATSAGADVLYTFDAPGGARLSAGEAKITHSEEGRTAGGSLVVSDMISRRVDVEIGDRFEVEANATYYLSLWAKPVNLNRCYGIVAVEWFDAQGNLIGEKTAMADIRDGRTIFPIYTSSVRPHIDDPVTPVWMEYGIEMKTPGNAAYGRAFLNVLNNLSGEARRSATASGTILIDDVSVFRSPHVSITTGEPGELVIEGRLYTVSVEISDMPPAMTGLSISGGVYDLWDNRKVYDSGPVESSGVNESFTIPDLERGFYEIRWSLSSAGKTVRHGNVATGIVPDPAKRRYAKTSPFALDAGFGWFYAPRGEAETRIAAQAAQRIGLADLRERLRPGDVNPAKGVFDWGRYETAMKIQNEHGIKILEIIHNLPEWLSPDEEGRSNVPPKNLTGIYDFFKQGTKDLGRYAPFWESWNEADGGFFMGRPEEFAGLQKAAFLGALAGNPDVRVTSLSYCTAYNKWSDRVFQNGTRDYFDIFNLHFYGRGNEDAVLDWIRSYRENLEKFGVDQPWWMTEMGMTTYWDSTGSYRHSEIQQAKKLVKSFVYVMSEGFEKYYYFYMAEFIERERDIWGIFYRNLTPKPAFVALGNMTGCLDKGEYIGRYNLGVSSAKGYVFHNGNEEVLVAWSDEPVRIQVGGNNVTARDMMGAPTTADKLTEFPIYIYGADLSPADRIERARPRPDYRREEIKSLSLVQMVRGTPKEDFSFDNRRRKEPAVIKSGEPMPVELTLANFWNEPVTGSSAWKLPEGWQIEGSRNMTFTLEPWEEKVISTTIVPMNVANGQEYEVRVESLAEGRKIAPVMMWVKGGEGR